MSAPLAGLVVGLVIAFPCSPDPGAPQQPGVQQSTPTSSGNVVVLPERGQTLTDQPAQPAPVGARTAVDLSGWS
ncbi:MAG TPA: hypothetical protein VGL46_00495 [Pseudonocardiaceae bacterium]